MKTISLTQGFEAIVDDEDYEVLKHFKWCYHQGRAIRRKRTFGTSLRSHNVLLHRTILGICGNPELEADHINRNPLDNRRANLRICTKQKNLLNKAKRADSRMPYKGVRKTKNTWWAQVDRDYLGSFPSAVKAAEAYDAAAVKKHGEFATTNKSLGLL